ncbi:MAG TPA: glycosyltransferase family 4 protein [Candidatus Paceibacterota bacterium]
MRVLITTGLYPPEIGGPATYSKCLAENLPAEEIEVSVLLFSRVRKFPKIIRHIVYFFLVLREGWGADIIYAQDLVSVGIPSMCAVFLIRKTFLLKVVGDYAWEQATQRAGFTGTTEEFQTAELLFLPQLLRALERLVARSATAVIVPSKYLGKLVRAWGVPQKNIKLIYNGIEAMGSTGNKLVLRGLINFHGKLLISVGRLVPWKGFMGLIETMPRLRKRFPDLKLLIVGSGPELSRLEQKAADVGLENEVIFTGALTRDVLIRYIRASDVFVLNTSYKGLSHQLLEVMAVGVPIVTTNIGGNPEVIEHEKNGFLVAPNDTAALARYTGDLLQNTQLRAKIVSAGKRTVTGFSNEKMVAETVAFLKKV